MLWLVIQSIFILVTDPAKYGFLLPTKLMPSAPWIAMLFFRSFVKAVPRVLLRMSCVSNLPNVCNLFFYEKNWTRSDPQRIFPRGHSQFTAIGPSSRQISPIINSPMNLLSTDFKMMVRDLVIYKKFWTTLLTVFHPVLSQETPLSVDVFFNLLCGSRQATLFGNLAHTSITNEGVPEDTPPKTILRSDLPNIHSKRHKDYNFDCSGLKIWMPYKYCPIRWLM